MSVVCNVQANLVKYENVKILKLYKLYSVVCQCVNRLSVSYKGMYSVDCPKSRLHVKLHIVSLYLNISQPFI